VWQLNEKELEAIVKLEGRERYSYLVKKAADQERLWSLWQDGAWALASNADGNVAVPIWPHEKYAAQCANETWQGFVSKEIPLQLWLDRWIPGMTRDSRLVAVFPTNRDKGVFVLPRQFADDLRSELENYE
jgi:hypothetical protein